MKNSKKRLCMVGIMMIIVGSTSFSNYPLAGDLIAATGAALVIFKEIMYRRRKIS